MTTMSVLHMGLSSAVTAAMTAAIGNVTRSLMATSVLGWAATGVFCLSYLFKRAETLRRVQAVGAGLWIFYGVAIGAVPVIVANVIVAGAALYSALPRPAPASGDAAHAAARREFAPAAASPSDADSEESAVPFLLF